MAVVYLDTCAFIDGFELSGAIVPLVRQFFFDLEHHPFSAVTSELMIAELLAPVKNALGMSVAERTGLYLPLLDEGAFIETIPVSRAILMQTSSVRRDYPQRLPDAIHIATALQAGCRFFMSHDRDARRLPKSLTWIEPHPAGIAEVLKVIRA